MSNEEYNEHMTKKLEQSPLKIFLDARDREKLVKEKSFIDEVDQYQRMIA